MKRQAHTKAWIICLGSLALALGCTRQGERRSDKKPALIPHLAANSPATAPPIREPHVREGSAPVQLMADASSPYIAGLAVEPDAIYLFTERLAYRIVPGASPQSIPIDGGAGAAVNRTDIIYWSKGAIWKIPKIGGTARRIAALPHQPQFFMTAGDDLAWLDMPARDQFVIQTLDGRGVRTLLHHDGRIETAAMDAGRVYFVRREESSSWRIGSVSVRSGEIRYASAKSGPTPAKLAVDGDVFYYDLDSNEIRRLSADLSREEALTNALTCSPIAVGARIYCPNMEGLYDLPRQPGAKGTRVFAEPRRIAAVAANSNLLVWLADAGPDRLSLMMLPLVRDE